MDGSYFLFIIVMSIMVTICFYLWFIVPWVEKKIDRLERRIDRLQEERYQKKDK